MSTVGERPQTTGRTWWWGVVVIVPFIIGHGCHGDDVDHEPSVPPIEQLPAADGLNGSAR